MERGVPSTSKDAGEVEKYLIYIGTGIWGKHAQGFSVDIRDEILLFSFRGCVKGRPYYFSYYRRMSSKF